MDDLLSIILTTYRDVIKILFKHGKLKETGLGTG